MSNLVLPIPLPLYKLISAHSSLVRSRTTIKRREQLGLVGKMMKILDAEEAKQLILNDGVVRHQGHRYGLSILFIRTKNRAAH